MLLILKISKKISKILLHKISNSKNAQNFGVFKFDQNFTRCLASCQSRIMKISAKSDGN